MNKNQEILSLAVLAGEILIKNGGEIFSRGRYDDEDH